MTTLYENYIAGGDLSGAGVCYGATWEAQSFTPSIAHIITSVKLYLAKGGVSQSPGTLTVSIRATDGDGKPTGSDLASGTTDGDTLSGHPTYEWREITLGDGCILSASVKYAIVARALNGDASNQVIWELDDANASYAGGNVLTSLNSGSTWTAESTDDFLFEDWGDPSNYATSSVTTQAVSAITATTATGNGNVTSLGAPAATQHGHCWATFPNPTTANSKTQNGAPSATGAYTSAITGLIQNTLYYCRAYITNSVGTFYGAQVTFITSASTPVVTTDLVTEVAVITALGNGSIDNNGGTPVTEHGVCWSVNANPTTADSKTTDGATDVIGGFFSLITGLTAATLYHVRAYATNSSGTGYGADVTFTTQAAGAPIITTEKTTNIQSASAIANGTIVNIGGTAVTQHGHCWSTSANPTTADSKTTNGAGVAGAFTSAITGLTAGTTYYTRAYATNSYGTSYGNNDEFKLHGEGAGILIIIGEFLAYVSKSGTQRALLGQEF